MIWEISETGKVSTATTTPSGSRNPAIIRGTPGRKDWAHHFSSLNLRRTQKENTFRKTVGKHILCDGLFFLPFLYLPVEVAALLGSADLRRGLQLDVACGRGQSSGVFVTTVHLTREQEPVIRKTCLHHGAEGLIGVHNPTRIGRTVDII